MLYRMKKPKYQLCNRRSIPGATPTLVQKLFQPCICHTNVRIIIFMNLWHKGMSDRRFIYISGWILHVHTWLPIDKQMLVWKPTWKAAITFSEMLNFVGFVRPIMPQVAHTALFAPFAQCLSHRFLICKMRSSMPMSNSVRVPSSFT